MSKPWRDVNAMYQIYPRSFQDSNGDGVGDLRGVTQRLDYLSQTLGVEAIWLSPIFMSPKADWGYDVSDYCAIDPEYGTMADFKNLLLEAHKRDIKVMLDLVPNHTSDQHKWFQESRSSRDNPKRDWYVWRDPKPNGDPPNNWVSISGGGSWTLDETTGQYYLHSFTAVQPDLNWDNPEVRVAMQDVLHFWFKRGVDGFRVDAVWPLSKDPSFADEHALPDRLASSTEFFDIVHDKCKNGPNLRQYLQALTDVVALYPDRFMIFEYYPDPAAGESNAQYYDIQTVNSAVASSFYFEGMHAPWQAAFYKENLGAYYKDLPKGVQAVMCFGNHDQSRVATRIGHDQARALAVMQMTLPGLPTMYYGEELGMTDVYIEPSDRLDGFSETAAMGSRDAERTPMQWDETAQAGFSTAAKTWLPMSPDHQERTVSQQQNDERSFLSLYRQLLKLRSTESVLRNGSFRLQRSNDDIMEYEVSGNGGLYTTIINFSGQSKSIVPPKNNVIVLSSLCDVAPLPTATEYTLRPYEAVIFHRDTQIRSSMDKAWKNVNAIYQIYPRSFQDSNGDGVGDLRGVINRLDYLKDGPNALGVEAIWFSPFYPSPMADFGYDVSNYCDIHPLFGNLDDFKELLVKAHARDMKVMIDFVPNHTSDQHPWFLMSKSSKTNDKREYYVWRDAKPDGSPPNNWLSIFGGSAWQWDESTQQYYLHTFLKEQPDLNWDNPHVRSEMQHVLKFWFDMGVDGIRADAVRWISKHADLEDDPVNPHYTGGPGEDEFWSLLHKNSRFGDKLFDYLREMTDVVAQYENRIMIFEDYPDEIYDIRDQYLGFYGVNPKVSMPFNFEGIGLPFTAEAYRRFVAEFQGMLNQKEHTPVYCFGNHDQPRLATRVGDEQSRLVVIMQLCLPGIPVIYYGDELSMINGVIALEQEQDPLNKIKPGLNLCRDPERTPMQWNSSRLAGFTDGEPWLPIAAESHYRNVEVQRTDADSHFSLYQSLLRMRDELDILRSGDYETFSEPDEPFFVFGRRNGEEHVLVVLNFSNMPTKFQTPHGGTVLIASHPADLPTIDKKGIVHLRPYEAAVIECAKHPLLKTKD